MSQYSPAWPHSNIKQIFPDIFFVTGTNITEYEGVTLQHSRNMIIVRCADSVVLRHGNVARAPGCQRNHRHVVHQSINPGRHNESPSRTGPVQRVAVHFHLRDAESNGRVSRAISNANANDAGAGARGLQSPGEAAYEKHVRNAQVRLHGRDARRVRGDVGPVNSGAHNPQ